MSVLRMIVCRWSISLWSGLVCTAILLGCKDLSGTQPLPAGTVSPSIVQNVTGAVQTSLATQVAFQQGLANYILVSGLLTDELTVIDKEDILYGNGELTPTIGSSAVVDARSLDQNAVWAASSISNTPIPTDNVYQQLQIVRGLARQAIGGLTMYAPDSLKGLRGEQYALLGYAEVMLADLFCSGVPLSTLDFQGDFTYQAGATTDQIYQHAIAVFDTARTLAGDTSAIGNLARVGQGRAFLALGQYAAAGQAVSQVPIGFQYVDSILNCINQGSTPNVVAACAGAISTNLGGSSAQYSPAVGGVSDVEGGTGLPFRSSHDPRTLSDSVGVTGTNADPVYIARKYGLNKTTAFVVASGTEVQLITAEADLNAGNSTSMFTILNALRSGNALTSGKLPSLTDPGTFGAEVDTLFTERAAWLFDDGHRQGDLRRLVRQYASKQGVSVVANRYPSGSYPGLGLYGSNIDAPVPAGELSNPYFHGCLSRDIQ